MKKRFITLFVSTLAIALIVSTVFYYLLCEGLRQVKRDAVGKFNYLILDSTYYNAVFIGSSSLHVGIDPFLFDSLTGYHSFNGGMDGMQMAEVNMVVRRYIQHHGAPKQIFLNIDESTLGMEGDIWYFPQYYPFINAADMKDIISLEPKLLFGKYFPPAAVTYFDDPLKNLGLIGLLREYKKTEYDIPLRGYTPKTRRLIAEGTPQAEAKFITAKRGMELLEETITFCRQNKTQVNILLMPRYNYSLSDSSVKVLQQLKSLETKHGIRVFDYSTDKRFESKELFYDRIHLHETGAAIFTSILAKEFTAPE